MHFNFDEIEQIRAIHRIWRQWRLIYIESNLFKCSATIPTYKMWKFSQLDLPAEKIWIGSFHLEFWSQIGTNSEKFEDEGRPSSSCDQPCQVPEEPPPGTGTQPTPPGTGTPPPPPPGTNTLGRGGWSKPISEKGHISYQDLSDNILPEANKLNPSFLSHPRFSDPSTDPPIRLTSLWSRIRWRWGWWRTSAALSSRSDFFKIKYL